MGVTRIGIKKSRLYCNAVQPWLALAVPLFAAGQTSLILLEIAFNATVDRGLGFGYPQNAQGTRRKWLFLVSSTLLECPQ